MNSIHSKIKNSSEYSEIRSNLEDQNQILTSAIVSTYNSEKFFSGCIKDLINQSLYKQGKLEILIIDSNSQQAENEISREFEAKNKNITYVRTVNREPLYAAWNRAIPVSAGKYLTNANTDDRHHPKAISLLSETLEKDPGACLAYGDLILTHSENQDYECTSVSQYIEYPDFDPVYQIHFGQCGPQPVWRKDLHQKYGQFYPGFAICADYEWWLRISRFEKFIHVPKLTGLYLDSPTSVEHREPARTQFQTDTIRNFYAAASEINLDHDRYPNKALQNYYSRYSLQRDTEFAASLICVVKDPQTLQSVCTNLHSVLTDAKVELIVLHDFEIDTNYLQTFSDKLRIRTVRANPQNDLDTSYAIGALHAGATCLGFINSDFDCNEQKLKSVNQRFNSENIQVLMTSNTDKTIAAAFYRTEVFDVIRQSNDKRDYSDFMTLLRRKIFE